MVDPVALGRELALGRRAGERNGKSQWWKEREYWPCYWGGVGDAEKSFG